MKRKGIGGGPGGPVGATDTGGPACAMPGSAAPRASSGEGGGAFAWNRNGLRPVSAGVGGGTRRSASATGSTTAGAASRLPRAAGTVARGRSNAGDGPTPPLNRHHSTTPRRTTSTASTSRSRLALASMPFRAEVRGELQGQRQGRIRLGSFRQRNVLHDHELRRGFQRMDEAPD